MTTRTVATTVMGAAAATVAAAAMGAAAAATTATGAGAAAMGAAAGTDRFHLRGPLGLKGCSELDQLAACPIHFEFVRSKTLCSQPAWLCAEWRIQGGVRHQQLP